MADNTTTYTAEVDINVNGGDKLQQTGEQAEQAASGFVKLQLQIRQTQKDLQAAAAAGDKVKFNQLRNQLDELEEGLEKVQFQAKQFDDQLASLPGPAGAAGNALKQVDGAFKLIVANPIVATIGAIVGLFLALRESLERTEEGQKKLNQISEAFTKILNGLFAVIEPLAMIIADFAIKLLQNENVMKGLSIVVGVLSAAFTTLFKVQFAIYEFIINNFIIAFQTLAAAASGAGKVIKGVFTFDLDLIKQGATEAGDAVTKGLGKLKDNVVNFGSNVANAVVDGVTEGFAAGSNAFTQGAKRLTDAEKKALEEANKKKEEAAKKAAEAAKKAEEERLKNLAAANKVQTEAYLATLAERDKEIYKLGQLHNERMLALEKAGITDKTAVAEQYRIELAAINKKYDDQEAKDKEARDKEAADKAKAAADEAKKLAEEKAQAESQARADRAAAIGAQFDYERALGKATFDDELKTYDSIRELERQDLVAKKASADAILAFDKATAAQRIQIERAQLDTKLGIINDALGAVAEAVGRESAAGKALSIAQAVISTYQGANKALATYPPPWGAIAAGTVIAAGLLNVKKILSTQLPPVPKPGGGTVSSPSVGSSIPAPSIPSGAGIPQVQIGGGAEANPTTQIAQTLSQATSRPIQAYVVSQQVSSQQAFDRRTNVAATMG